MIVFTSCENEVQRFSQSPIYCVKTQETKKISYKREQSIEEHCFQIDKD